MRSGRIRLTIFASWEGFQTRFHSQFLQFFLIDITCDAPSLRLTAFSLPLPCTWPMLFQLFWHDRRTESTFEALAHPPHLPNNLSKACQGLHSFFTEGSSRVHRGSSRLTKMAARIGPTSGLHMSPPLNFHPFLGDFLAFSAIFLNLPKSHFSSKMSLRTADMAFSVQARSILDVLPTIATDTPRDLR